MPQIPPIYSKWLIRHLPKNKYTQNAGIRQWIKSALMKQSGKEIENKRIYDLPGGEMCPENKCRLREWGGITTELKASWAGKVVHGHLWVEEGGARLGVQIDIYSAGTFHICPVLWNDGMTHRAPDRAIGMCLEGKFIASHFCISSFPHLAWGSSLRFLFLSHPQRQHSKGSEKPVLEFHLLHNDELHLSDPNLTSAHVFRRTLE